MNGECREPLCCMASGTGSVMIRITAVGVEPERRATYDCAAISAIVAILSDFVQQKYRTTFAASRLMPWAPNTSVRPMR